MSESRSRCWKLEANQSLKIEVLVIVWWLIKLFAYFLLTQYNKTELGMSIQHV